MLNKTLKYFGWWGLVQGLLVIVVMYTAIGIGVVMVMSILSVIEVTL